jgi:hypothetical protein
MKLSNGEAIVGALISKPVHGLNILLEKAFQAAKVRRTHRQTGT